MPKIKMTLDDYKNNDFSPIPEGEYVAYVYEVEPKRFRTGSEGFSITYNVGEGEYKGRKIFDNIVLTPNARWKLAQFWEAMTGEKELEIDTDKLPSFVGRQVIVRVGIDKERDQNVVKNLKYHGGVHKTAQDDLNGYLENREPIATGSVALDDPSPLEISDDDLPF